MQKILLALTLALSASVARAGLDITALSGLTQVAAATLDSDGQPQGEHQVILSPVGFPERFDGLRSDVVYAFKSSFAFRAGSYSGYNAWRNELAKLAGYKASPYEFLGKTELRYDATVWQLQQGPFWELINFSDAEGVIGPVACKKVYQDFVQYSQAAEQHSDLYFRESYADWKKAFEMCADNGAIVFH